MTQRPRRTPLATLLAVIAATALTLSAATPALAETAQENQPTAQQAPTANTSVNTATNTAPTSTSNSAPAPISSSAPGSSSTNAAARVAANSLRLVTIRLGPAARALAPQQLQAYSAQKIRAGSNYTITGGYKTFASFKKAAGTKKNYEWHHIVEQSTLKKKNWDVRAIHNTQNLVQIPTKVHQKCVNSWMSKKRVKAFGVNSGNQTMRQKVHAQPYKQQHQIGVNLLRHCGVQV